MAQKKRWISMMELPICDGGPSIIEAQRLVNEILHTRMIEVFAETFPGGKDGVGTDD